MKKIFYRILIICFILIFITNIINVTEHISKAANYSFNVTGATSAKVGDTLTYTINANGLTGNVKLSGNNVSLSDSQKWVERNTVTFTAKVNAFPASVTATPVELTDNDYNIVSIAPKTITINQVQVIPEVNREPETNPKQEETKPNDNSQENNNQSNQNQGNNNKTNSSKPSNNYQNGSSTVKSNPTINENGTTKSGNNYLKSLQVSIGTLSPEFYRETYEYTVDNIIEDEIIVTAEAEDEKAIVNGLGTIALSSGENRINIEVVAENEQARTYVVVVNKLEEIKESDLRLDSLQIQTINEENEFNNLDIGFDKDTLDYKVLVEDNITDLSIIANVDEEGVIIETAGDKNLKEGDNIVTVTLSKQNLDEEENNIENQNIENNETEENMKEKTIYTIKVTRKAKPVVEISNDVYKEKQRKIIAIILLVALITILIAIAIVSHLNSKNENKMRRKKRNKSK